MEKIVRQGILYDFYGELLTEHQKQVYEAVVDDNLSQSEIADQMNVSRQAVHDLMKRTDVILEEYESKLGLMKRFGEIRQRVDQIKHLLAVMDSEEYGFAEERAEAVTLCDEVVDLL
mgnify:CR=1 FL=1